MLNVWTGSFKYCVFHNMTKNKFEHAIFVKAHNIKAVVHKSKYVWNAHKEIGVLTHP